AVCLREKRIDARRTGLLVLKQLVGDTAESGNNERPIVTLRLCVITDQDRVDQLADAAHGRTADLFDRPQPWQRQAGAASFFLLCHICPGLAVPAEALQHAILSYLRFRTEHALRPLPGMALDQRARLDVDRRRRTAIGEKRRTCGLGAKW